MTHTKGPWVGFSDDGQTVAIMPAGRDGDVCTFKHPPSEADANLMIAAPRLFAALKNITEWWAYAMGKDSDAELTAADHARVEELAIAAAEALHAADPSYGVR